MNISTASNSMRLRNTIEFLGIWEKLNNSKFNLTEFDQIKNVSGSNAFVMTATKWVKETNAIGIKPSRGKYSEGTFAHRDIALEFASYLNKKSPNHNYEKGNILNLIINN